MFKSISIKDWRQFSSIAIDFHPRLTILTGANGAGKTTILNLLNRHFGWNVPLIGTPRRGKKGILKYFSDYWHNRDISVDSDANDAVSIGEIHYDSGSKARLVIPRMVGQQYSLDIQDQESISGVFIPSHRPVYLYQQVQNIPTTVSANEQLLQNYLNEIRKRYNLNSRVPSASFRIKEAIISLATFGYGNEVVKRNQTAINTFEQFQRVLSLVLPKSIGFRKIVIQMPEVVLDTKSGQFSFDAVSGGIAAIIDMAWQLFMASTVYNSFVVVIDEPENHLHPTLQKLLLPNFLEAFPSVQFIVATHNPLMVTSVSDSNVYVLNYNEKTPSRVNSSKLDLINRAASSNEILRDVLGLEHTKPIWVEERISQIVDKYSHGDFSSDRLKEMRAEMRELKLDHLFPETLSKIGKS